MTDDVQSETSLNECPLACPLCQSPFSYRDYVGAERTCPSCKVPVGFPFYYRAILTAASLTVYVLILCKGYYEGIGAFMVSVPLGALFALFTRVAIMRMFPPRLEAYAESSILLSLKAPDTDKASGEPINSR